MSETLAVLLGLGTGLLISAIVGMFMWISGWPGGGL